MKKVYTCVLFDWDGCIVNSLPLWYNAFFELFPQYGIHISAEEIALKAFHYVEKIPGIEKINLEEFMNKIYLHVGNNIHRVSMCRDVEQTLKELKKKNKKTAVITSSKKETFLKTADRLNCLQHFDIVLTRDDVKNTKPHSEALEKAMKNLNAYPDDTLIIGDSDADIVAGKNAGITTIWFYPEENKKFYKKDNFIHLQPDFVIEDMQQLLSIVG